MKRLLKLLGGLPHRLKAVVWAAVTVVFTIVAFIAESAGAPRFLTMTLVAVLILPTAAGLAKLLTPVAKRRAEMVKVARA